MGLFQAELLVEENGLFDIENGDMNTLVHVGAVNAPEFAEAISTTDKLKPLAAETGGTVQRVSDGGTSISLPTILPIKGTPRGSDGRLVLKVTSETELKGVNRIQLFAGFFGLALLFLAFGTAWYREGTLVLARV